MNKTELIRAIAKKSEVKKGQASSVANALFEVIKETLKKGEEVKIGGFGTFFLLEKAAREGRNPRTGKPIKIPAKKAVKFRPSRSLREIA